jgi:cell fate regulator YaaT (PSP1 superfamily)
MPIVPLPQFEADLAQLHEEDRQAYEALKAPKTLVVRFGSMKLIGEYPYDGSAKPGCGSKLVVRTHRGTELAEMLTSTCPNSGCSKSVSRQEILRYVENSGGKDYPFFDEGRVLRVASREDLDRQAQVEQSKHGLKMQAREIVDRHRLPMKVVDAEPILGGERLTIYFLSEERIDFRELAREMGQFFRARVDLRQVGARDEARLTADYEKCGQYCCCKNFLKVLKPISMKAAKVQKATLDPLKISGRCGRLMCCLRYEDQTYADLQARLPKKRTRVGTPDGDGIVIDSQILTQLVLVQLDGPIDQPPKQIAVAVEELTPPRSSVAPSSEATGMRPPRPPGPRGPERDARQARPQRPDDRSSRKPDVPTRSPDPTPPSGPSEPMNDGPPSANDQIDDPA